MLDNLPRILLLVCVCVCAHICGTNHCTHMCRTTLEELNSSPMPSFPYPFYFCLENPYLPFRLRLGHSGATFIPPPRILPLNMTESTLPAEPSLFISRSGGVSTEESSPLLLPLSVSRKQSDDAGIFNNYYRN